MTPGVNSSTGAITTAQSRAKNNTSGWNNSDSAVADLTTSLYEDSSYSGGFNRFILSSCDVNYSEKTQIMTTFGDSEVVYYFGKNPVIMNLQGILIDSLTDSWFVDFVNTYQTFLRGSQLAQNFQSITLVLPTMTVVGSVISLGTNENASRDTDIPFSMQFYAKSIVMTPTINPIGLIASNVSSKAIFNKATRTSMGASLPTLGSGFTEPSWVTSVNNFSSGITTPANTFATNVTSAITTTIASVTKFIGLITKTLSNLITAFTAPLNAVLRVITSVTGAVNAVASLVASSAASIGHLLSVPGADIATALSQLKNTAGVIHRLPQSVSQSFKANFHAGNYRSSGGNTLAILSSGKTKVSKVPALNSGYSYTPNSSVII